MTDLDTEYPEAPPAPPWAGWARLQAVYDELCAALPNMGEGEIRNAQLVCRQVFGQLRLELERRGALEVPAPPPTTGQRRRGRVS